MQQSCLLPASHLFWVEDDWRLGAGPSRRGSACRCAQVGWAGGDGKPQSDGSRLGRPGQMPAEENIPPKQTPPTSRELREDAWAERAEWNPRGAPPPTSRPGARSGPAPSRESGSGLCLEYSMALCSKQKYGRRLHAGLPPSSPNTETPETQKHLRIAENNNGD